MAVYTFQREQLIPTTLDELWDFISSPKNLKVITPDYMGFDVISDGSDDKMYEGMIISYYVRPVFNIKMKWVTEITHIRDKEYFVDEQRVGPYNIWHHQHILTPTSNGILMKDIVTYQPPMGPLGAIANKVMIEKKLKEIFEYRRLKLEEMYGTK